MVRKPPKPRTNCSIYHHIPWKRFLHEYTVGRIPFKTSIIAATLSRMLADVEK
jgi:hypothetical protein